MARSTWILAAMAALAGLSGAAEATIIAEFDYFTASGSSYPDPFYANYRMMQTFVPTQTGTVSSVDVTIAQVNASTAAPMTVNIFALTPSALNGLQPSGGSLSVGQLLASDTQFDTYYSWKNVPMTPVVLTAGVSYGLVVDVAGTDQDYYWISKSPGSYASGYMSIAQGAGAFGPQYPYDLPFRVDAVVPEPGSLTLIAVGLTVLLRRRNG